MDLDELDRLAEKADPDTWKLRADAYSVDDSLFIAACSPERIRALIALARGAIALREAEKAAGLTSQAGQNIDATLAALEVLK